MTIQLQQGDVLEMIKSVPDSSIQCCVTSPPYYGLRDYQTAKWEGGDPNCDHKIPDVENGNLIGKSKGKDKQNSHTIRFNRDACYKCGAIRIDRQIGLEETPDDYVSKLVQVFREVRRVLKDDGTCWLNLGDSYVSMKSRYNQKAQTLNGGKPQGNTFQGNKTDLYHHKETGLKDKDLIGIPWTVAFALRADGWYLRSDIIWAKPNPMPESVKDRPTKAHEYLFLLTKSARYYYDYKAILEPANYDGRKDTMFKGAVKSYDGVMPGGKPQSFAQNGHERWSNRITKYDESYMSAGGENWINHDSYHGADGRELFYRHSEGMPARNKRTVWSVNTKPFKGAHFAVMPEKLVEPCILAGSRIGDTVIDPFCGSGTVGAVSKRHGRSFVGIDLNPEYIKMAKGRINEIPLPLDISTGDKL